MALSIASLSLDLDNQWAYLRSLGRRDWAEAPSFLPSVAARVVDLLDRHRCGLTVFVVGRDLQHGADRDAVRRLSDAGCEVANHSQNHLPWLDRLNAEEMLDEVATSEEAIETLLGEKPVGFRAPGFSWSPELFNLLTRRGYRYDASTWPTPIGPLVRRYSARLSSAPPQRPQRFGTLRDGFRRLSPYIITTPNGALVEVPVTTMPFTRLPIHATYLMHLRQKSAWLAHRYIEATFAACRAGGISPSMLLHPLDFLGREEAPDLAGFPGMGLSYAAKSRLLDDLIQRFSSRYRFGTIARQVERFTDSPTSWAALTLPNPKSKIVVSDMR